MFTLQSVFTLWFLCICFSALSQQSTVRKVRKGLEGLNYTGYIEYLPYGYDSSGNTKYPVIIYQHGQGEIGNGSDSALEKLFQNDLPKRCKNGGFPDSVTINGITKKFIVLAPQSPVGYADVISNTLSYFLNKYPIDTTRIYLTGISMGGGQVRNYVTDTAAAKYNNIRKIAAVLTISAPGAPNQPGADKIASENMAFWGTHNQGDPAVSYYGTTTTINRINNPTSPITPPVPLAKKTIFPGGGHDAWTQTYNPAFTDTVGGLTVNIYQWFLLYTNQRGANLPPTANAGSDISITLPVDSTTLHGSGSDPDGTITGYSWTKLSGGSATIVSPTSASTQLTGLAQGTYQFILTVTDNGGLTASDTVQVTVNAAPSYGLTADFFTNRTLTGSPALTRVDSAVNFNWGTASPGSGIPQTQWSARWHGFIKTDSAGSYQFSITSDDGARLILNTNDTVINNFIFQSTTEATGSITLPANSYIAIKLEYFQGNGGANCVFRWTPPGSAKVIVPYTHLFQTAPSGARRSAPVSETSVAKTSPMADEDRFTSIRLFPNPTPDAVQLQLPATLTGRFEISILSATGRQTGKRISLTKGNTPLQQTVSLQHLRPGIYLIRVDGNNFRKTMKIVKQ